MDWEICSVTLAAGVGRRMPQDMPPKPCCKIGPLSVIENALRAYEEAGIHRHVVVVGHRAAEIMSEASRAEPHVLFAFQERPLGTGDAVRCALDLLNGVRPPEHVLICTGDKVVAPHVIRGVVEAYRGSDCDLYLVVGPSKHYPGSGKVVERPGLSPAIIEVPDIRVRALAAHLRGLPDNARPGTIAELRELVSGVIPDERTLAVGFPALHEVLRGESLDWSAVAAAAGAVPDAFDLPGGPVSVQEAEASPHCNLSVYAGRFDRLRNAVHALRTDNAQGQCYFTDVLDLIGAAGGRVGLFRIQDPEDVMAFNNLDQLEHVRRVHARRMQSTLRYPPLERWHNYLARRDPNGLAARAVDALSVQVGHKQPAIVVRSPGRINLMGRHIDHQGGTCNLMAIDREIVIAACAREDDRVNLWNLDYANFPSRSFTFGELTADVDWADWLRTLDSQYVQRLASESAGDWSNYVKGTALRLLHRFQGRRLRGMDAVVYGNIPQAAGLSSSSALVVAAAEALTELNGLNMRPKEFVDLCGEGEWFVGTRGGAGDHAAIKFGREREVVSVSFFPFQVVGHHPFPEGWSLMVCNSGIQAGKVENAQERFNARVACYHMAREILRREVPEFAGLIQHLRDVNTQNLDVSLPGLYSLLLHIPVEVAPDEVERMAAEHPVVDKCVRGLNLGDLRFPVRDVALFGLAECDRSRRTGRLLDGGDVAGLGRMMDLSHDGDRVARWMPERTPFEWRATDDRLRALVQLSASPRGLALSGAALWEQPGAYRCSTPEIDRMVDSAGGCTHVAGAQLAGAGLGGCIMVLVEDGGEEEVRHALERDYYEPEGIEPQLFACRPSTGSQVLTSVEAWP